MAELDRYLDRMSPEGDVEAYRRTMQAVVLLREVFLNLVKHGKTARMYGRDHHLPERFLDAFSAAARRYLEQFELMVVEVHPDHFTFSEHTVLAEDVGERLAYGLYAEGVRAISVEAGCDDRELTELANLLAVDWLQRGEEDDDLLAAAWRADFQHVHIDVVDRFADADEVGEAVDREALALGRDAGNDPRRRGGDSILVPEIQAILRELESEASEEIELARMKQDEVQALLKLRDEIKEAVPEEGGDEELMVLDAASAALLEREVERVNREEDADFYLVSEVLFELGRIEDAPQHTGPLGRAVARGVLMSAEIGDFESAATLVRRLLALLDADLFPDFRGAAAFREGYAELVSEDSAERLLGAVRRQSDVEGLRGPLFTILAPLPVAAVPQLVRIGAAIEGLPALRQVFADAVVTLLHHDGDALLQLLEQSRGADAAVPLLALGRLDVPRGVEPCLARLQSPEDGVREAALRSLRRYQSPNIKASILRALDDPARIVRVEALRYLSVYRDPSVLDELAHRIRDEAFSTREEEEIKAWLMAYGIIGRERSVELLRDLALDAIKQRGDRAVLRAMAVRGLHATRAATAKVAMREVAREHPALRGLIQGLMSKR